MADFSEELTIEGKKYTPKDIVNRYSVPVYLLLKSYYADATINTCSMIFYCLFNPGYSLGRIGLFHVEQSATVYHKRINFHLSLGDAIMGVLDLETDKRSTKDVAHFCRMIHRMYNISGLANYFTTREAMGSDSYWVRRLYQKLMSTNQIDKANVLHRLIDDCSKLDITEFKKIQEDTYEGMIKLPQQKQIAVI